MAFIVTQFFIPVKNIIGPAFTFWSFAIIMLLVMVFSIFFVPETKGKSLEEIQNYFKRKVEKHETPDGNFTFDVEEEIVY